MIYEHIPVQISSKGFIGKGSFMTKCCQIIKTEFVQIFGQNTGALFSLSLSTQTLLCFAISCSGTSLVSSLWLLMLKSRRLSFTSLRSLCE